MHRRLTALCGTLVLAASASAQEGNYWDTMALPGPLTAPVVAFGTNITLRTATDVWVYTGILREWTQIPVSPAAQVFSEYNDQQTGPAGGIVSGLVGLGHTYRPIGQFGVLMIDLQAPHFAQSYGTIPASGRLDIEIPMPLDMSLSGLQVHMQNVVKPPGQRLFITSSVSPIVM